MLEKLCGVEGLGNVVLATTMWDIVDRAAGEEREQLLLTSMKDYWGESKLSRSSKAHSQMVQANTPSIVVQQGSKVFRQDRGAQSATEIVDYLVRRKRTVVLELQRELVDNNKYLHETEAGKVILAQYVKQRQSSEQNLERPKEDLKRALLTNDKEHQEELIEYKRESEAEMVRDEEYLRRLKVNQQQIQNEMRETVQQHRQNMQSTETKAQSLAMRHQPDMKRDRDSNDKNAVSLHASSDHYQAPIQENIPGWVIAANNDDAADVDMAAILDPSSYASKLDDLEAAVHQKCRIHDILQTESDGMLHVLPTPREGVEIALEELLLAMNLMQEQRFCTDNIIVLVQDLQRSHVVRACDISIQDVRELYELTKDRPRDTTRLRYLVNKLLRIFIQHPGLEVSATYPQLLRKPLESLCSFLRLATAVYVESHCSDLSLEDFSPAESIVYEVIDGCKYVLSRRRLACLHNFIGGPVWVFESARTSAASSLSITVEQFADLWGPLHTVSSSEGAHRPLAIHTEGGTIFRVADEKADKVQLASETSCHWMRTSPMGRSYKTTQANFLDLLCSDEEFSQELLPFSADQRLLIGHPSSSTRASTAIYNKSRTSSQPQLTISVSSDIEFSHHQECRFDFEEFGAQNAFNMRAAGTMPAYYSPNEYQLGFSAGQYVNVGLHKTWKRRPSVTYKDRIMSFCCSGSLATPERVKQVLQLLLGLEVSACTFNAQRVSLEQVIRTAFPSDANIIDQACTAGDASILATYLGELRFSGVTERENQVLLYWPLSKGIGEVFCHIDFPRWSSMLKDTPDSCCFATLSPRCLQFATNYSGRLIGSLCSPGSVYLPKSTLRSTIHVNPHECLRLPLKQGSDIAIENGSLRIHHADEKFHIAFLQHRGWKRLKTLAGRDKRNIHRELLDPSRTCKSSFEVCIMDDPAV